MPRIGESALPLDRMPSNSKLDSDLVEESEDWMLDTIIYFVGLSEGLTHMSSLAIFYLLKDDLALDPAVTSAVFTIPAIPWFIKPFLAFFSDAVPIFGCRRKPYLIIFGLVQALGYLLLAQYPDSLATVICGLFIVSLGAAVCSAVVEALVVEKNNAPGHATIRNASWSVSKLIGAKALGSLLVAYLSGSLLEYYTKQTIFRITAIFPVCICISGAMLSEPIAELLDAHLPAGTRFANSFRFNVRVLKKFISQKVIWGPCIFILVFMCGPDYDEALFYYYTNTLKFSPTFMGSLRLTYGIAAVFGIVIYQMYLCDKSYRSIMMWTLVINLPIYISPLLLVTGASRNLGISDELFVLSGGFLIEAVAEVQLLPLLVFATLICPVGLEGTVCSFIMCIRNLGTALGKLSSSVGIYMFNITSTDYANLGGFIILCTAWTMFPMVLIYLIPTEDEMLIARETNLLINASSASGVNEVI